MPPPPRAAEGRGSLLDANTVEVLGTDGSKRSLKAKEILIATGGSAVKLDIPGAVRASRHPFPACHATCDDTSLILKTFNNSFALCDGCEKDVPKTVARLVVLADTW